MNSSIVSTTIIMYRVLLATLFLSIVMVNATPTGNYQLKRLADDPDLLANDMIRNFASGFYDFSTSMHAAPEEEFMPMLDSFQPLGLLKDTVTNGIFGGRRRRIPLDGTYQRTCNPRLSNVYNFTSLSTVTTGDAIAVFSGVSATAYITCVSKRDGEYALDVQLRHIKRFQRGRDSEEAVQVTEKSSPMRVIQSIGGRTKRIFIKKDIDKAEELIKKAILEAYQTILEYRSGHSTNVIEGTLAKRVEQSFSFRDAESDQIFVESSYTKGDILETGDEVDIEDLTKFKQHHRLILDSDFNIVKSEIRSESAFENDDDIGIPNQQMDGSEIRIHGGSNLYFVKTIERKGIHFPHLHRNSSSNANINKRESINQTDGELETPTNNNNNDSKSWNNTIIQQHTLPEVYPELRIPGHDIDSIDDPLPLLYDLVETPMLIHLDTKPDIDLEKAKGIFDKLAEDPQNRTSVNKLISVMKRDSRHTISDFLLAQARKRHGATRKALLQVLAFTTNPRAHSYILELVETGDKTASVVVHFIRKPQEELFEQAKTLPLSIRPIVLGSILRKQSDEVILKYYKPFLDLLVDDEVYDDMKLTVIDGMKNMGKKKKVLQDPVLPLTNQVNEQIRRAIVHLFNFSEEDLLQPGLHARDNFINDWTGDELRYQGAGPSPDRELDVHLFPAYKSFIGSKQIGFNSFFAQFTAAFFAGHHGSGCFGGAVKILSRISAMGSFWGKPRRLLAAELTLVKRPAKDHSHPSLHSGYTLTTLKLELGRFTIFRLPVPMVCSLIRYEILDHMLVPAAHFSAHYPIGGILAEAAVEFSVDVGLIAEFEYCTVEDSTQVAVFGEIGPCAAGFVGLSVGVLDVGFELLAAFWVQIGPSAKLGPAYSFDDDDMISRVNKRDGIVSLDLPLEGNETKPISFIPDSGAPFHKALLRGTIDTPFLHKVHTSFSKTIRHIVDSLSLGFSTDFDRFRRMLPRKAVFGPPNHHFIHNHTWNETKTEETHLGDDCVLCFGLSLGILPCLLRFSLVVRLLEVLPMYRNILWSYAPLVIRPFTPLNHTEKCFVLGSYFRLPGTELTDSTDSKNGSKPIESNSTRTNEKNNTATNDTESVTKLANQAHVLHLNSY